MKLKVLGMSVVSVLAVVIIPGCGGSDSGKTEELEQQVASVKQENARLAGQVKKADGRIAEAENEKAAAERKYEAISPAHRKELEREAKGIVAEAEGKAAMAAEGVEEEAAAAEERLSGLEESIHGVQQEKSLSSFGEGVMKGEVDYTLGATYEAPGGGGCYWALLNSANTSDMNGNEYTEDATQQIITIETPYFTSEGCGTWKRIE